MPSVLVECGFVTNRREAEFLNSTYGQEIIASAIFRAFRGTLESNYPDIAFRRTTPSTNSSASTSSVFGIQIASSKAPIATDHSYFKKAKLTIERKELNTKSPYKYISPDDLRVKRRQMKRSHKSVNAGLKTLLLLLYSSRNFFRVIYCC